MKDRVKIGMTLEGKQEVWKQWGNERWMMEETGEDSMCGCIRKGSMGGI